MVADLEETANERHFRTTVLTITPMLTQGDPLEFVYVFFCSQKENRPQFRGALEDIRLWTMLEK